MTTSSELKLADCPFCGSDDVADDRSVMFCATCEAVGPRISFGRPRSRQELWNHRTASRPSPTEEMVELREALEPFREALMIAAATYEAVETAQLQKKGLTPLLAAPMYAAMRAVEGRLSWANWKALRAALKSMEQGDG